MWNGDIPDDEVPVEKDTLGESLSYIMAMRKEKRREVNHLFDKYASWPQAFLFRRREKKKDSPDKNVEKTFLSVSVTVREKTSRCVLGWGLSHIYIYTHSTAQHTHKQSLSVSFLSSCRGFIFPTHKSVIGLARGDIWLAMPSDDSTPPRTPPPPRYIQHHYIIPLYRDSSSLLLLRLLCGVFPLSSRTAKAARFPITRLYLFSRRPLFSQKKKVFFFFFLQPMTGYVAIIIPLLSFFLFPIHRGGISSIQKPSSGMFYRSSACIQDDIPYFFLFSNLQLHNFLNHEKLPSFSTLNPENEVEINKFEIVLELSAKHMCERWKRSKRDLPWMNLTWTSYFIWWIGRIFLFSII